MRSPPFDLYAAVSSATAGGATDRLVASHGVKSVAPLSVEESIQRSFGTDDEIYKFVTWRTTTLEQALKSKLGIRTKDLYGNVAVYEVRSYVAGDREIEITASRFK